MEESKLEDLSSIKEDTNLSDLNKIASSLFESIKEVWKEGAKGETHITSKEDEFNQVKSKFTSELSKSMKKLLQEIFIPGLENKTQSSKVDDFKEETAEMIKSHLDKFDNLISHLSHKRNKSSFNKLDILFGELKKHLREKEGKDISDIEKKVEVKLDKVEGTLFKGEIHEETELPHGIGVKYWPNGTSYQGYFQNGEFHKFGILKKKGGEGYIGDWHEGKIIGEGKTTYADGSSYEGTHINDGEKTGKGIFVFENGDRYEGDLVDEEFQGIGVYTYADGVIFEGEFKDDDKNGQGKYKFKDGTILSGFFENDLLQGTGKYEYPDGSSYEGEFVNGEKQGFGVFKTKEGLTYEGQWLDNKYEGKGSITYPNGDFYEGEFKTNKFEGKGVFKWEKGMVYRGQFKEGFRHGKGRLVWGVSFYEGEWAYDKPHGKGNIKLTSNLPEKFGLWVRGYQVKSLNKDPGNVNIQASFQKIEADEDLGGSPFSFNFNGMLEFLVNEEIYKEYKREVNIKSMLDRKIKKIKKKIKEKSKFKPEGNKFVERRFDDELMAEEKLKTIFDSSLVEFEEEVNPNKEKEVAKEADLNNSRSSKLMTNSEIVNIELGIEKESQEIFRSEVIFESIRDGNGDKIKKIFEYFINKKNFKFFNELEQMFSNIEGKSNSEIKKLKRIGKAVKYLFSLKDSSERTILQTSAAHGHHTITMHFCAILLNLVKNRVLSINFFRGLLFNTDTSDNNLLELTCIKGFDEHDLDIADFNFSCFKSCDKFFLKEIDEFLEFKELNNLKVFQKMFDRFENDSKRLVTSDIHVVTTRAFTIYVILYVSKFLGAEETLIRKQRYHLLRNNPLHWAFYHSDPFSVALLVEFKPDIIFWANELRELPPQYIKFTKNPRNHDRAVLILQSMLNEISRVLINQMRLDNIIKAHGVESKSDLTTKSLEISIEKTDIVNSSYRILSKALSKTLTENNKEILEKANEFTSLEGSQGYPYITKDFRFLKLLELLSSESRTGSTEMDKFKRKYKAKLQNMMAWFAYTNGSILAHHSIFIKYNIKAFRIMIGGQSIVHTLCISNSSIALKKVLKASEYYTSQTEESKRLKTDAKKKDYFRELFNVGTDPELNTPAHLCLIHNSHECFDILMRYGVDLYIPNARGWTASDLLQSQVPLKFSQEQIFTDTDAGKKLVNFFRSNILFTLKSQSLVSKYMKGDPKIDIQLLRDIVTDTDFYCKDQYTPEQLNLIKSEFLRLYQDQKEEYTKIKTYFEGMERCDKQRQIKLVKRSKQEAKYEDYSAKDIIKSIEKKEINPNRPLSSKLKYLYDMKAILCIVLYSDLKDPKHTMIYEQLQKIRHRYQDYDGGIKIDVIKGLNDGWKKGCFYKLLCCLKKNRLLRNQFSRYKYFFVISFSDLLLTKFARDMKLVAYNMKYDYYTNFSDFVKLGELEPLRETQKQRIVMKIINQEFNLNKFKTAGYVSNYFMMHRYKMRGNMTKFWWKNFRKIHYENIWKQADFSVLTPISLIAFYHGLQHGFYIGFLSLYTNCLFYLAAIGVIFELLKDFTLLDHSVIPVMSAFVALWSSFFITLWQRRQKELAYSFGTHKEQLLLEQRGGFKGRTVLKKINRGLEKAANISSSTKRILTSPLFAIGASCSMGVYFLVKRLNEMNNQGELVDEKYHRFMNFGIGIINGTLNFILSQIYNRLVDKGVNFENYKYEKDKINSEIFQKVLFKLFSSCLTITIMVFVSEEPNPKNLQKVYTGITQELLERQILSNILTSSILNYIFNIGKPFYFYLRQRYVVWKFGCFCKKSKIDYFKKKKLKEFKNDQAFREFVLRENYVPRKILIASESGSKSSSLLKKPSSNFLKLPIFPGLTKSILFLQKRKEVMLEYIKYVIGLEKVEETSIMIETQNIEIKLYTSLLTQFAYINFFIPYCLYIGVIAAGINFIVIFLMMTYYGYLSKKSVSRRMKNIGIWMTIFRIVSLVGVVYNAFIIYKRRGTVFKNILPKDASDFYVMKIIVWAEHAIVAMMFMLNYYIEVDPKWVNEKIKEEEYAESLQRGFKEEKLNSVLKKCDIDILKNQEEKDLECVFKKGMKVQKLVLPNGYDDIGLINVTE